MTHERKAVTSMPEEQGLFLNPGLIAMKTVPRVLTATQDISTVFGVPVHFTAGEHDNGLELYYPEDTGGLNDFRILVDTYIEERIGPVANNGRLVRVGEILSMIKLTDKGKPAEIEVRFRQERQKAEQLLQSVLKATPPNWTHVRIK
ncbi:MAG: hypothetical protein KA035_00200 [Candidatus Levybacteria bacterium]|nr:hypothetical protein [Candidatus Levybacteria bacterium]